MKNDYLSHRGQEYVAHTKCITEAQRYGGKDFVAKPGKNKGERKQQDWIQVVQSVIETSENLSGAEKNILNILSNHENVPRKKAKFINFIKSVLAGRVNMAVVESVWGRMEQALKKAADDKTAQGNTNGGSEPVESIQTDIVENENNENLSKEYEKADSGNKQNGESKAIEQNGVQKAKKSKKRKTDQVLDAQDQIIPSESESRSRLDNDSTRLTEIQPNGTACGKRTKKPKLDDDSTVTDECQNNGKNTTDISETSISKFDWVDTVLSIVKTKEEISLKKLRKKVLARYRSSGKSTTEEKAVAKFDKKINKMTQIVVNDGKVKLVRQ